VVVADLDPDGVAAQKGLQIGDIILEAGGRAVNQPADVKAVLAEAKKDNRKAVLLRVKNGEGTHFVAIAINPAS
jgi:serine protease Do